MKAIFLPRARHVKIAVVSDRFLRPRVAISFPIDEVLPAPDEESQLAVGRELDRVETFSRQEHRIHGLAKVRQSRADEVHPVKATRKINRLKISDRDRPGVGCVRPDGRPVYQVRTGFNDISLVQGRNCDLKWQYWADGGRQKNRRRRGDPSTEKTGEKE